MKNLLDFTSSIIIFLAIGASNTLKAVVTIEPANPIEYQKIEFSFDTDVTKPNGEFLGEESGNLDNGIHPFMDYRLNLYLTSPSGKEFRVPGFFAGDGSDEGESPGDIWRARFRANEIGTWSAEVRFENALRLNIAGDNISGVPLFPVHGQTFSFHVANRSTQSGTLKGYEKKGFLKYTGEHYLQFENGQYYLGGQTNSPETFMAAKAFDRVDFGGMKTYTPQQSYVNPAEDPYFESNIGANSNGIIGTLNYLNLKGVNGIYFLAMNIGGDGGRTFPMRKNTNSILEKRRYDLSKMHQWEIVFNHANQKEILLNMVLAEQEVNNINFLDNTFLYGDGNNFINEGEVYSDTRKLFHKMMISHFSHHPAIKWILCEENGAENENQYIPQNEDAETEDEFSLEVLFDTAKFFQREDPYQHPITVHTDLNDLDSDESLYAQLIANSEFNQTGATDRFLKVTSNQIEPSVDRVERLMLENRELFLSQTPYKPVIMFDEPWGPVIPIGGIGSHTENSDDYRKRVIWKTFLSGGNLAIYFGGPQSRDIGEENMVRYENFWNYMRNARIIIERFPFWEMDPTCDPITNDTNDYGGSSSLCKAGDSIITYFPKATNNPGELDLSSFASTDYIVAIWYNPRTAQLAGNITLQPGIVNDLPAPPSQYNQDWVLLVKKR